MRRLSSTLTAPATGRLRPRLVAAALVLSVPALAGCGINTGRGFQVGVKQVGVNLSFANGSLVTTRIVHLPPLPVASYGDFLAQVTQLSNVQAVNGATGFPPSTAVRGCPRASKGARPDQSVKVVVSQPPATGVYREHNTGKFTLVEDGLTFNGPYPPQGEYAIQNETRKSSADSVNGTITDFLFDLVENGVDGSITTTTYRAQLQEGGVVNKAQLQASTGPGTTGELDLVKQVVQNSQGTSTFAPSSPVEIVGFNRGVGASWNSAGIDSATGTVMTVSGSITAIDQVDVCGHIVEAYRVVSNEKVSNPDANAAFTSSTSQSDPNVYDIAPQFGGLMVREHIDTTTTYTANKSATVVTLNYTSVLNSVTPQ
jgi:predicted small secreted protein